VNILNDSQNEYKAIDSTFDYPYGINNVVDIAFNIRQQCIE
jgi:hypothetical protein